MDRRELTHQWAAQSRPRRKAGNISYDGPTLYSYSTGIAHIHMRKVKGALFESANPACRFVLMAQRDYSKTTACHKSTARSAVSHLPLAEVPHIQPRSALEHGENCDAIAARLADCAARAARRTTEQRVQWDAERAAKEHKTLADYLVFFNVRRKMPPMPGFAAAFERARRIENPDPASADKRERAKAARKAAKDLREKKARELAAVHDMARRSDWRLYGAFNAGGVSRFQPVMLRLCETSLEDCIETSLGARIPTDQAPGVWAFVQRVLGRGFTPNGLRGPRIGDYQLDRIDADGTLHAGCHTIPYSELRMMARALKLAA